LEENRDPIILAHSVNVTLMVRYNYRLGVPKSRSIARSATVTTRPTVVAMSET